MRLIPVYLASFWGDPSIPAHFSVRSALATNNVTMNFLESLSIWKSAAILQVSGPRASPAPIRRLPLNRSLWESKVHPRAYSRPSIQTKAQRVFRHSWFR
jgi:hypothetical protein